MKPLTRATCPPLCVMRIKDVFIWCSGSCSSLRSLHLASVKCRSTCSVSFSFFPPSYQTPAKLGLPVWGDNDGFSFNCVFLWIFCTCSLAEHQNPAFCSSAFGEAYLSRFAFKHGIISEASNYSRPAAASLVRDWRDPVKDIKTLRLM